MHPPSAQISAPPPVTLIGPGRVGSSLDRAARMAGLDVTLLGRHDVADGCAEAASILLCVPDAEIEAAARAAVEAAPKLQFLGHTSGARGLDALATAAGPDIGRFSLHPLQTVPDGNTDLTGAPAAIAGSDEAALEVARGLAERVGMLAFEVSEESRAAYHAAASMASNFLVALEESASELLAAAGVEDGRELLSPLVLRTAANWAERGPEALTGPIARGDEETVDRHLEAIEEAAPDLAGLYRALATRTRELAAGRVAG